MKRSALSLVVSLTLLAAAFALIRLNFAGGTVEVGRGVLNGYILPFAPFLLAIALCFVAVVLLFTAAFGKAS